MSPPGRSPDTNNFRKVVRLPISVKDYAERILERLACRGEGPLKVEARIKAFVPFMQANVSAGFPSPADDYLDRPLDFNELLIANPAATFAVRIGSDSMINAGIFPGDIAIVDRSVTPKNGDIILALIDNEFTIKRYRKQGVRTWLQAENPAYTDIPVDDESNFQVWGVVGHTIRIHKAS